MNIKLPREIDAKFNQLKARLWKVQTLQTSLAVFVALSVSWLLVFFLDRQTDTAAAVRLILLSLGCAFALWPLCRWLLTWVVREPGFKRLAVLVQRRYRLLGDRLLGIVELANESTRPAHFSEELYEAAIKQVSDDASTYDFDQSVSTRQLRRLIITASAAGLVIMSLSGLFPGAAANAFARWIAPYQGVPRYTLVRINNLEARGTMVHGEPFEVAAEVRYLSFWRPKTVRAQFDSQRPLEPTSVADQAINLQVPGQFENRILEVRVGDATARLPVEPVFRPKLIDIGGEEILPGYLQRSPRPVSISGGVLEVLEGSTVSLHGTVSRELKDAELQWSEESENRLTIDGANFSSAPLSLTNVYRAALDWRDRLDLRNAEPWQFTVRHNPDRSPAIELPELGFDNAILDTEVLALRMVARDDFGVDSFGLDWRIDSKAPDLKMSETEFHDGSVHRSQPELDVTFYFSPSIYGVPAGVTMALQGFATDFLPGREPVKTAVHRIHVVSSAEHAELLRSRLESLLTYLEEIGWLQEKLLEASTQLSEDEGLDEAAMKNRLEDQIDDQGMNAAQLNQLAQQGFDVLQEAMRNARFSDEMMEQWTQTMSQMQSLAQQDMAQASQSLSSARRNQENRSEHLSEAQRRQRQILEALEALQTQVNEGLDAMEAMTLAERLRSISARESEMEEKLMESAADVIGKFPDELAPRYRAIHDRLFEKQTEAGTQAQTLQQEIGRFFERTARQPYGDVNEAMKETKAVEAMMAIGELIQENIAMQAAEELSDWAKQFDDWASLLEPEESGGGGGGEGGEILDLTRQLMALLRLRESELTLRVQTTLLERKREEFLAELLTRRTGDLSVTQQQLRSKLEEIILEMPILEIEAVLQEAREAMDQVVERLDREDTGEETVASQTEAIDVISDAINLINEQARRMSQGDPSMAQQIAMMMQMASMGQGRALGTTPSNSGNPGGGDTDRTAEDLVGQTSGDAGQGRSRQRSSGRLEDRPTEFRRAFEQYYRQLERLERQLPGTESVVQP